MNSADNLSVLFLLSAFGAFLIAMGQIFHLKNSKNRTAFFMYLCMAYLLVYIKMVFDLSLVSYSHLFLTGNLAGIAAGCLCYFYVCSLCDDHFILEMRHLFVIIGCIAVYAIPLWPFWTLPAVEKSELIRIMVTSGYLYWHEPQILGISVFKISNVLFSLNSMIFLLLGLIRLWRSFDREGMWRNFYFYLSVLLVFGLISRSVGMYGVLSGSVSLISIAGLIFCVFIFFLYLIGQAFPWVLYERNMRTRTADQSDPDARVSLKDTDIKRISEKLRILMGQDAIYKKSDLTVSVLAAEVGVAPHQLSAYLNQVEKKRFTTYLNEFRIVEAQRLFAADPKANNQIVARETGFNSDTYFYFVFQAMTGISPGKYRRQLKKKTQNF